MPKGDNFRLETWKEVAAFFNRDERTVKRWEVQRGLPVRRLPGAGRSRISALVSDLEAWRDSGGAIGNDAATVAPIDAAPALSPPPDYGDTGVSDAKAAPRQWGGRTPFAAAAVVLLLGLGWFAWSYRGTVVRSSSPSFAAQQAYVSATLDWQKRTPDGLERAEREYRAAIAIDPGYAAAYVGLANTYNLLREYTGMPDAQAYPLARKNALQAIALDGASSQAHAALAFAEYWGFWNVAVARAEFARAVELDPRNADAHRWYATFLSNLGEETAALREIDAAAALEPHTSGIATDRGLITALSGRLQPGLAILQAQAAAAPGDAAPLLFIAELNLKFGDYPAFLAANRRLAAVIGEPAKTAAPRADEAYRRGGGHALLAQLIADARSAYLANRDTAFHLAMLQSLAGDQREALTLLRTSVDRRESAFLQITNPADFRALRETPAFTALLTRLTALDG